MPFAMCASTGFVPQWYMKTPGSPALKRKLNDSPGATSLKATFGAMRAAWKSIECGIAPPFVSVISTVWPSRTWTTGPGAPWPSNAHVLYLTPGRDLDGHVLERHVHLDEVARRERRQRRVVGLVRRGELGRVLRHDAGEAAQRQRHVVVGRVVVRRGAAELGCGGGVARVAGVRPHHQREEADHGDRDPEQHCGDLGETPDSVSTGRRDEAG